MAKYVFGFIGALLIAGLVLLNLGLRGEAIGMRGGGVVPATVVGPDSSDDIHPPDLIVTDLEGAAALTPFSFCWEQGNMGVCAEGGGPTSGNEPDFTSAVDQPVNLDFQVGWDLTLSVEPDGDCPSFAINPGTMFSMDLDSLGPAGDYVVSISARNEHGDASWIIRVHNEIEAPCGGDG